MTKQAVAGGIIWKDNTGKTRNTWGWNSPAVSWPGVVVFAALSPQHRDKYPVHESVCGYCPGYSPILLFETAEEVLEHRKAAIESYSDPAGHPSYQCRVVPPAMAILEKPPCTTAELAAKFGKYQVIPLYEEDLEDINHGLAFGLSPSGWAKIKLQSLGRDSVCLDPVPDLAPIRY